MRVKKTDETEDEDMEMSEEDIEALSRGTEPHTSRSHTACIYLLSLPLLIAVVAMVTVSVVFIYYCYYSCCCVSLLCVCLIVVTQRRTSMRSWLVL